MKTAPQEPETALPSSTEHARSEAGRAVRPGP